MQTSFGLLTVGLFIFLTAFFVAAEFAIVKVRRTRIDQLVRQGNKRAGTAQAITADLNSYLSTTQLGITVTGLLLGWIGEPVVSHLIQPIFSRMGIPGALPETLSTLLAFFIVTFLSVVLGELTPKGIAIQRAEQLTLAFSYPLVWIHRLLFPLVWLLNTCSSLTMRLFGIHPEAQHESALTEGEIRLTLSDSFKNGEISQGELRYMSRIFDFDERSAREIMVPRTEMICVDSEDPPDLSLQILHREKYTRFPVIRGDKDHVLGILNIKDIFSDLLNGEKHLLNTYTRPVLSVLETTPIRLLLEKMQKKSMHMAILTDEYGGTSGLVTVEDILEEIVGEIHDEFDEEEEPMIRQIDENESIVNGKLLTEHVNRLFQTDIQEEGIDTIGGWLLARKPDIRQDSVLEYGPIRFEVLRMEAHQITKIRIKRKSLENAPS